MTASRSVKVKADIDCGHQQLPSQDRIEVDSAQDGTIADMRVVTGDPKRERRIQTASVAESEDYPIIPLRYARKDSYFLFKIFKWAELRIKLIVAYTQHTYVHVHGENNNFQLTPLWTQSSTP